MMTSDRLDSYLDLLSKAVNENRCPKCDTPSESFGTSTTKGRVKTYVNTHYLCPKCDHKWHVTEVN